MAKSGSLWTNRPFTPAGWPTGVRLYQSDRKHAGQGQPPYEAFNVALHVGDDPAQVLAHRLDLLVELQAEGVRRIDWLEQVHGTSVLRVGDLQAMELGQGHGDQPRQADAAVTAEAGQALAIMTADCLPVVLCDATGQCVAGVHAGWRGLCAGVIEAAAAQMAQAPTHAWLGPCIGPQAFEVGAEVREAFLAQPDCDTEAVRHAFVSSRAGHYWADLPALARLRLEKLGISAIVESQACTVGQSGFYSYRREGRTGRLVTLVWITP